MTGLYAAGFVVGLVAVALAQVLLELGAGRGRMIGFPARVDA